jgi:membrane protein YdbS with pleckstrin-like domain
MADPPPFWSLKPWWCQPWSIVLTGLAVVAGSWWVAHRWWFTLPLGCMVMVWWVLFLVLAPRAHAGEEGR